MTLPKHIETEDQHADHEEAFYEQHRIVVDKKQVALRIDKFLMNRLQQVSRTKIQTAAEARCILVNEKPVKSNYKIKPADEIVIILPNKPIEYELKPENIPLNILHEDDDIIIINKPAGLVVHPGVGNHSGTLVNALLFHLNNLPKQDIETIRPGLVHRIDKNTSGILVVAKNEFAMSFLAKQFFDHTVKRKYRALVWGEFEEPTGIITGNITRHPRFRKLYTVSEDDSIGKSAETHYSVIENFGYVSLIECVLKTGRTHQIRVHMQHIGHPVFSDDTYGGNKIVRGTIYTKYKQFVENCFTIMPRQALHAKSLQFIHPTTGKEIFFDSDLPADFTTVLDKWRNYSKILKL